ncbi:HSP20 family molecular chaperone IbpA [Caldalkalibacillus uzonensis]|uniref:HSP20 family molecular chaperone IbpA n=1 Tax=Caldalkalibacillus uzonensis TaxID=353224 RepID=A0ABU0CYA9_9BACI|nr:Hsp20/alpha crystallin family protein [Caldalkalibacillus uzonensis]MDQ0341134.1 HSP20 family molecular chaperone IbpA [Caldalkalibacillus uzonensis]
MFHLTLNETDQELKITIMLPGINKEQVKVYLEPHGLHLSVNHREESEFLHQTTRRYFWQQSYRRMERFIPLPFPIEKEKIQVNHDNNRLIITIPKAQNRSRQDWNNGINTPKLPKPEN